jgi:hypothetical protein
MLANEYKFITRWRLRATASEIYDLIATPLDYPRWWPSVYLQTKQLAPPDESGLGRRVWLLTKGWLPYTLRWESSTTEADRPRRIAICATGDFNGRGIWTFEQENDFVDVTFDWQLTADKPLLRYLSILLKPVFSANHVWAMARGKQSLELELARRHAPNAEARSRVPSPPGPNKTSGIWLSLAAFATFSILIGCAWLVVAQLRAR